MDDGSACGGPRLERAGSAAGGVGSVLRRRRHRRRRRRLLRPRRGGGGATAQAGVATGVAAVGRQKRPQGVNSLLTSSPIAKKAFKAVGGGEGGRWGGGVPRSIQRKEALAYPTEQHMDPNQRYSSRGDDASAPRFPTLVHPPALFHVATRCCRRSITQAITSALSVTLRRS
jgi:hypothetical protein